MKPVSELFVNLGRKIREKREEAGLSQAKLGDQVGLSRASISLVEKGFQRVQLDTLYSIAQALNVSPDIFIKEEDPWLWGRIHPNHLKELNPSLRGWLKTAIARDGVRKKAPSSDLLRQGFDAEDWNEFFDILWGMKLTQSIPVDVRRVADAVGVSVLSAPYEGRVSSVLIEIGGSPVIALNSARPLPELRFTAAHAMAHYLVHRKDFHLDVEIPLKVRGNEAEANLFAANLLLPRRRLKEEFGGGHVLLNHESLVLALADRFQVPTGVLWLLLLDDVVNRTKQEAESGDADGV
jgi:Zn-dependent peptidase ImmA (M78 family)/transcriptional regulator with XRE-family HTH domain